MLPRNPEIVLRLLLRWTNGDEHAAAFLMQMAEIARLADNIVDEDANRQRNVCWLLSRALTALPVNPFFIRHADRLSPLIGSIIVQWQQSDVFRMSGDPLKQTHGFVMREAIGTLVNAVAYIIGGYDHAKLVADEFFETCHAGSTETVAVWAGE